MIEFHLDPHSGVAPYLQIVQQVKGALRLGMLGVGDQLPTVKEAVAALVINPNTVLKANRDLEHEGPVVSRPGQGTFIVRTLAGASLESHAALRRGLTRWLRSARRDWTKRVFSRFSPQLFVRPRSRRRRRHDHCTGDDRPG
jgi:GntR family transcriptional regulator